MKVLFLTLGTEIIASSRTRVYQYIPYLEDAGIKCFVVRMLSSSAVEKCKFKIWRFIRKSFNGIIKYLKVITLSICCDVVFIQKVLLPVWRQNLIKLLNKNIIFDFDDAIYTVPYVNVETDYNAVRSKSLRHILSICRGIILENNFTEEFARKFNKNILVITGPIDCTRYCPKEKQEDSRNIIIGWIGSPGSAVYLQLLFNVFKKISKNYPNIIIELIGAGSLEIEGINLVIKDWDLDTEVENLHDFDIGIMPLTDDEWSRGKGGYKLLQYMAVGIPCVTSPIGINSVLVKEGVNGYLANSEDEWYEKLEMLIKDGAGRKLMGANGRRIAEEQYSLEVSARKLIETIKKLGSR